MDEWMDGWIDGWMDGWMNGWMDGWMDGWMTYDIYILQSNWGNICGSLRTGTIHAHLKYCKSMGRFLMRSRWLSFELRMSYKKTLISLKPDYRAWGTILYEEIYTKIEYEFLGFVSR